MNFSIVDKNHVVIDYIIAENIGIADDIAHKLYGVMVAVIEGLLPHGKIGIPGLG